MQVSTVLLAVRWDRVGNFARKSQLFGWGGRCCQEVLLLSVSSICSEIRVRRRTLNLVNDLISRLLDEHQLAPAIDVATDVSSLRGSMGCGRCRS